MVTLQEDSQYFLCYDKETDPGTKVPPHNCTPILRKTPHEPYWYGGHWRGGHWRGGNWRGRALAWRAFA